MEELIKKMELLGLEDLSIEESVDMAYYYGFLECMKMHTKDKGAFIEGTMITRVDSMMKEYNLELQIGGQNVSK